AGVTKATGPLANLTNLSGSSTLDGEGTTSRGTVISTELTARVVGVLPGGDMMVEASKDVEINSDRQIITVRGVVRQADIATDNTVPSDRLAQLEIRVNGKGVINDATHRPFILYRLLLGLLPF
ncbi:MAG: flagellar basal body L-ring protein FlgH, partial [Bryobacteraceae bacterium]